MKIQSYIRRSKNELNKSTLNSRESALRSLEEFVSGEHPAVEEVEEWADYMLEEYDEERVSSGTIEQYFKSIRYYYETMGLDVESIEHIGSWFPQAQSDPGDYLTLEELNNVRGEVDSLRTRAILEVMYYYGRRPGEIRLLNLEDVVWPSADVDTEDPWVLRHEPDGSVTFTILKKTDPTLPELILHKDGAEDEEYRHRAGVYSYKTDPFSHIKEYLPYRTDQTQEITLGGDRSTVHPMFTTDTGRVSLDTIDRSISHAAESAGVDKNITPKSMRHSRATHLYREGVGKDEIASRQLAHSPNSDVVGRYLHEREEDKVRDPLELDGDGD